MKAKVFRYKSDGNTVVAPYMELEPYAENVYLSLSEKNEYGNEVNFRPDEAFAGHLSYIIDCLPPVNGVDDVTTLKTEEEAV